MLSFMISAIAVCRELTLCTITGSTERSMKLLDGVLGMMETIAPQDMPHRGTLRRAGFYKKLFLL